MDTVKAVSSPLRVSLTFLVAIVSFALTTPSLPARAAGIGAPEQGSIPAGTVITPDNWQQYRQFMAEGLQAFFSGQFHWKLPPDFRMLIGPTNHYAFPATYQQNTERYSSAVKIVNLPGGQHTIAGYVAGLPFPDPQEPNKGYKLLVDVWYAYIPRIMCGWCTLHFLDRFNNLSTEELELVYRRLNHISEPGVPTADPNSNGVDYSEYIMVLEPEQSRYTANLQLYYNDPTKPEDIFLFLPSLRRTLRLSVAARCSPVVGTDYTQDDSRYSVYNAGIARMDATYLSDRRIITLTKSDPKDYTNFANYYPGLLLPKPVIGQWEVRDTYQIDARRVPSQRKGYCYGKRIMYVDKEFYQSVWTDLYDENLKLWKVSVYLPITSPIPGEGSHPTNQFIGGMYDLQNGHVTHIFTGDKNGYVWRFNQQCENYLGNNFNDVKRYSSVAGLSEIVR